MLNRDEIASARALGEVTKRYGEEVSPSKPGERVEVSRSNCLVLDNLCGCGEDTRSWHGGRASH